MCLKYFISVVLVTWVCLVDSKTTYVELKEIAFMRKYGYLTDDLPDGDAVYTPSSVAEAVKKVQAFAGLPQTGLIDLETKKLFSKRRCGVKDIDTVSSRSRRYIIVQGWNKRAITYRVINGSTTFEKSKVEAHVATALAMWAPYGNLDFIPIDDGQADIRISFVSKEHDDGFPFDGPGHVVAHAFPPPHGAMHFDDDETWGDNPAGEDDEITDFFAVAVHEIGHALGLSHSSDRESVMYPYYQVPVERLHMDDILGMQELYLKDQQPEDPPEATEDPVLSGSSLDPRFTIADSEDEDIPNLCYTNYDTVQVIQGKIFVFEEEWVWVLSQRKTIDPGYPRLFHELFRGLPDHVNVVRTIYEKLNGNIVIFSGKNYWEFDPNFRFIKRGKLTDYSIHPQVPELTTVFISNYNNKTYLISYERFWRFDESTGTMDVGYPKDMSAWRDIPSPVDAALVWQGDTFFFRGPRFWRFDNGVIQASPYYPLPAAPVWFPCEFTPDMEQYAANDYR